MFIGVLPSYVYVCEGFESSGTRLQLSAAMWVLGIEIGFSGKAASAPNSWAESSAPDFFFPPTKIVFRVLKHIL